MSTTTTSSTPVRAGTTGLARAVLAAAVLEVVAPVVTIAGPGASPGTGSGPDLLITPADWAFGIWGVIYALAIAQAVAVLVRGAEVVPRRLQVDQLVLYLGGTAWIVVAGLDSSLLTAAALAVMLGAAVDGVLTVVRHVGAPRWLRLLTRTAAGLYGGWVTAAFFLNVSTAALDLGLVEADEPGWQLVVLLLALATLLVLTLTTRGLLPYAAAGVWALLGIAATAAADGTDDVLALALASSVVLVVAVLLGVRRRRPLGG